MENAKILLTPGCGQGPVYFVQIPCEKFRQIIGIRDTRVLHQATGNVSLQMDLSKVKGKIWCKFDHLQ